MSPATVPPDEFEGIVAGKPAALPDWVRRAVPEAAFLVEDVPPAGAGPEHGLLLGQYHGVPLTRRGHGASGSLPDTIVLHRLPILRACRRAAEVPPRVCTVLLHEIGHALGLGEERLREFGVSRPSATGGGDQLAEPLRKLAPRLPTQHLSGTGDVEAEVRSGRSGLRDAGDRRRR